ncbi:MAG: META domain-containing protein [Alphaproteobacteria bacterium]|nr:META domain-containing protein [Alphaproteobacteria bacterium]
MMKNILCFFTFLFLFACSADANRLDGKEFVWADAPNGAEITIGFERGENGFYGKAAVNRYFGTYKIEGSNIFFEVIGSTMMMGPQELMDAEMKYLQSLSNVKAFKFSNNVLELYMNEQEKMVFELIENMDEN